jgi:hypothetical protein
MPVRLMMRFPSCSVMSVVGSPAGQNVNMRKRVLGLGCCDASIALPSAQTHQFCPIWLGLSQRGHQHAAETAAGCLLWLEQSHCPILVLHGVPNPPPAASSQPSAAISASEAPANVATASISKCRGLIHSSRHCEQLLLSTHLTASVFKQDINHETAGFCYGFQDRGLRGATYARLPGAGSMSRAVSPVKPISAVDCKTSRQLTLAAT